MLMLMFMLLGIWQYTYLTVITFETWFAAACHAQICLIFMYIFCLHNFCLCKRMSSNRMLTHKMLRHISAKCVCKGAWVLQLFIQFMWFLHSTAANLYSPTCSYMCVCGGGDFFGGFFQFVNVSKLSLFWSYLCHYR